MDVFLVFVYTSLFLRDFSKKTKNHEMAMKFFFLILLRNDVYVVEKSFLLFGMDTFH